MVKVRKVSRGGVTVKFAFGRFSVTHNGTTDQFATSQPPHGDSDIMCELESILVRYLHGQPTIP